MSLDLEIVSGVRDLGPEDTEAINRVPLIKRLRDSHHAVAKLLASGMTPLQVSLQTGYSPSRIATLQNDPAFEELLAQYRNRAEEVAQEVEKQFLLVAKDAMQAIHEQILDEAENIPTSVLLDTFKAFADRAGFAPIQRSLNKNLNVSIGELMDAARRRRDEAA